jgi:hypothetical protein
VGDCSQDGAVTVGDLLKGINIALGTLSLGQCSCFDMNGDSAVTVDELLVAVNNALNGCSGTEISEFFDQLPLWDALSPPEPDSEVQDAFPPEDCQDGTPLPPGCGGIGDACETCEQDVVEDDYPYTCTTTKYSVTQTPEKIVMFSPDIDILWPGALIQGRSYSEGFSVGSLDGLVLEPEYRAPITLRTDVIVQCDTPPCNSRVIENPDGAKVMGAINDIIVDATQDNVPDRTDTDFRMEEFTSDSQFALKLKVSARYLKFSAAVGAEIQTSVKKTTVGVVLWQKMYTAFVDPPPTGKPEAWFTEAFTPDVLQGLIADGYMNQTDNIPVFISSIVYGRMMLFSFTSTENEEYIRTQLQASYDGVVGNTKVDLDVRREQMFKSAVIHVTSIGGPAAATAAMISSGDWRQFFSVGAELSTAAPLVYTFQTLSNLPRTAKVVEATEYNVRECTPRRFVDNGDGTVTDNDTGLMWEKKTTDGSVHDVNKTYTWSQAGNSGPWGTVFTDFLPTLNDEPTHNPAHCFAGYCDWRLPKVNKDCQGWNGTGWTHPCYEKVEELESILYSVPCTKNPCIDDIFGPTKGGPYWSYTTKDWETPDSKLYAYRVNFGTGYLDFARKGGPYYVRAVRTIGP